MKFFKLQDGVVELDREEISLYPDIRKVLSRDKGGKVTGDPDGRRKLWAYKELSYVYFMCDFYAYPTQQGLTHSEAHQWTIKTVGLPSNYEPDEVVTNIMVLYAREHLSPSKRAIRNLIRLFAMNDDILEKVETNLNRIINASTSLTTEQISELITLQKSLMGISTTIPEQTKKLREAMTLLEEEEKAVRIARGGTVVASSMNPDNDIERE